MLNSVLVLYFCLRYNLLFLLALQYHGMIQPICVESAVTPTNQEQQPTSRPLSRRLSRLLLHLCEAFLCNFNKGLQASYSLGLPYRSETYVRQTRTSPTELQFSTLYNMLAVNLIYHDLLEPINIKNNTPVLSSHVYQYKKLS